MRLGSDFTEHNCTTISVSSKTERFQAAQESAQYREAELVQTISIQSSSMEFTQLIMSALEAFAWI